MKNISPSCMMTDIRKQSSETLRVQKEWGAITYSQIDK
jgi:hypothetical protein